jgi:S-layer protein
VEIVNIASNNVLTTTAINANVTEYLTLAATKATTLTLTGNAALNLTNTGNVSLTRIDGSAMTAGLTVKAAGTVGETIIGGAGKDTLTATGTVADFLDGGAGDDKLTSNAGLTTLKGGAGADTFVVSTASANVNIYTTIADAQAGDKIVLASQGVETFNATKLTLGDTAVFQDYANLAANSSTLGTINWFQWNGNTYIVEDMSSNTFFTEGTDIIVKLVGAVDLGLASFNPTAVTDAAPILLLG